MVDLPPPTPLEPPQPEQPEEAVAAEEAAAPVVADEPPAAAAPKKRKAFRALEIAAQVHQVQEWLTEGKRPNQIRQLCSEQWGLETRVAEHRIQDARRQMVADANVMDRQEKVGQMLQQLEQILEQALQMKQGSNAIGALRLQADLLQLLARQN
jgi:citrate synthase